MIPWENTSIKNMIYLTLFGTGAYGNKRVTVPGCGEPLTMEALVTEYLRRGQRRFEKKHKEYPILETVWFDNFMKFSQPLPAIRDYLYDKNKTADSRGEFLDTLIQKVREYSVFDARTIFSSEEKVLWDYFGILISIVGNILKAFKAAFTVKDMAEPELFLCTAAERREWKRQGEKAYLTALMNRDAYLKLINEFLEQGCRDDWERGTLHDYPVEVYRKRYEMRLLWSDYINTAGDQTVGEWMAYLQGEDWEHASAGYLMRWLRKHENSEIPVPIRQYITQYYYRNIDKTDFYLEPFTSGDDSSNPYGLRVLALVYFATVFSLEIPQNKTEELLFLCKYPPSERHEWLPSVYFSKEELCEQIARNLKAGIANETVLSWHILYCIDHPDDVYTDTIARVAKNQLRKKWVRQIAMQYICKRMDADTACEQILPRMQGDMFFFVAEQYRRAGSERLARLVWHYGEKYATHKLRCDVMLIHLQNRRGIDSFINHIEKRHMLPVECRGYGAVEAIRNIDAPELLDELERFFALGLKNSFRDEPVNGILEAASDAMVHMAFVNPEEYDAVSDIFHRYLKQYQEPVWKRNKIEDCIRRIER